MGAIFRLAVERETAKRAARLALVVGPILVAINQGDVIVGGESPDWLKAGLTFIVPYCVSTWTSVAKEMAGTKPAGRGSDRNDH